MSNKRVQHTDRSKCDHENNVTKCNVFETSELIDAELVVYDRDFGYIYKSRPICEYEVSK